MKNTVLILICLLLVKCTENSKNSTFYGKEVSLHDIVSYHDLKSQTLKFGLSKAKIKGEIIETCKKKGCWMNLKTDKDTVFVRFRDYAFFVPTDSVAGKTAIIEGDLFLDTISIEMLKHYAEDGGKSQEEISLITKPKYDLNFTADGVVIID